MIDFSTNIEEVYRRFEDLTYKEQRKVLTQGLRKVLRDIRKDAVSSLRSKVKNTNKRNPKYNDTLEKGVRLSKIFVSKDGTISGSVKITSTGKSGSGSFRLPILESGSFRTGVRYAIYYKGRPLRKKRKTGVLRPTHFFAKVRDSKENYFNSSLKKYIDEAVNKVNHTL